MARHLHAELSPPERPRMERIMSQEQNQITTDEEVTQDPKEAGPKPPFPKQTQNHPGMENQMRPRPDYGLETYQGHGRLKGKVALITGGDSGIGRAVALAFAREGVAAIAIGYLPEESVDADEARDAIMAEGVECLTVPGDLADEAYCRRLISETAERFGRIDILVNNAAFQGKALESFDEFDTSRVEKTLRVNILAPFILVREALPYMQPGAVVINVASIQAYSPSPEILDYAMTKGALVTLTKGLTASLSERGIRVNAVAPGPVWTPIIAQSFGEDKVKDFGKNYPMERPAQPVELAPAFVFLASEEARFVNGEILGVTGGKPLG